MDEEATEPDRSPKPGTPPPLERRAKTRPTIRSGIQLASSSPTPRKISTGGSTHSTGIQEAGRYPRSQQPHTFAEGWSNRRRRDRKATTGPIPNIETQKRRSDSFMCRVPGQPPRLPASLMTAGWHHVGPLAPNQSCEMGGAPVWRGTAYGDSLSNGHAFWWRSDGGCGRGSVREAKRLRLSNHRTPRKNYFFCPGLTGISTTAGLTPFHSSNDSVALATPLPTERSNHRVEAVVPSLFRKCDLGDDGLAAVFRRVLDYGGRPPRPLG